MDTQKPLSLAGLSAGDMVAVAGGIQIEEDHMRNVPQVLECHNTTGTIEYMLRVQAADLADYKRFHTEVLQVLEIALLAPPAGHAQRPVLVSSPLLHRDESCCNRAQPIMAPPPTIAPAIGRRRRSACRIMIVVVTRDERRER